MNELNGLENILASFLGDSKSGVVDGQVDYCCPQCADDDGIESDGKFNLAVNFYKNCYHCWKCECENDTHGKISNLIKRYGNESILSQFREEVKNIKKSKEYEFDFLENGLMFEEDEELIVALPLDTYDFKLDGNKKEAPALKYLMERGMGEYFIRKFDLKYTDSFCRNRNFRNRIIIPSYDKYGILNYYTGRDYSGKSFRKYYNYENSSRKDIIFNEKFINWDGDVYLVEGPTDHLVVPNSIPLLGKSINSDFYLFECIIKKSKSNIIVFLDNDATSDAFEICRRLSNLDLCGRLKIIPTEKSRVKLVERDGYNSNKLDPNKMHEIYGYRGISWILKQAEDYVCL